jgi:hypothetical protein
VLKDFFHRKGAKNAKELYKGPLCDLGVFAVKVIILSLVVGYTSARKVESQALNATMERSIMHFQESSSQRSVDPSGGATGNEF